MWKEPEHKEGARFRSQIYDPKGSTIVPGELKYKPSYLSNIFEPKPGSPGNAAKDRLKQ